MDKKEMAECNSNTMRCILNDMERSPGGKHMENLEFELKRCIDFARENNLEIAEDIQRRR